MSLIDLLAIIMVVAGLIGLVSWSLLAAKDSALAVQFVLVVVGLALMSR